MKKESAELQVGAFPNILFKWGASRPIGSRPLGSSPDKLCGLAPEPQPLFFVCGGGGVEAAAAAAAAT